MQVTQVESRQISKDTLMALKARASFVDTDKSLNEFMVSMGSIVELLSNNRIKKQINSELEKLYSSAKGSSYIHITNI